VVPGRDVQRAPAPARAPTASIPLQCARREISETRFLPIVQRDAPHDLLKLRSLLVQLRTPLDWTEFGPLLWNWGNRAKRDLMETYYLTLYAPKGKQRTL